MFHLFLAFGVRIKKSAKKKKVAHCVESNAMSLLFVNGLLSLFSSNSCCILHTNFLFYFLSLFLDFYFLGREFKSSCRMFSERRARLNTFRHSVTSRLYEQFQHIKYNLNREQNFIILFNCNMDICTLKNIF